MKEIYRVLNENGQFLIIAEKYKINYHMMEYKTEREMKELFNKTGYKNIEYTDTKYNMCIKVVK